MSILLLVALPALGFLFLPRPYWEWILAAVPALLITLLHVTAPWRSYEDQLFTEKSFAHIKGVVVDDRLPIEDSVKWLEPPRSVEVRLTHLRFSSGEAWRRARGRVLSSITPMTGADTVFRSRRAALFICPGRAIFPAP